MSQDKEIYELLEKIDRKQDKLIERLFGDLDNENPKARFPLLETDVKELKEEVISLNNDRIRVITFASVISGIVGFFLEYLFHPLSKH